MHPLLIGPAMNSAFYFDRYVNAQLSANWEIATDLANRRFDDPSTQSDELNCKLRLVSRAWTRSYNISQPSSNLLLLSQNTITEMRD